MFYENPKSIETYRASIGLILQEIFDRKTSISDLSNYDIHLLRNAFIHLQDKEKISRMLDDVKSKLVDFGESIEKFDLYSYLRQKEEEIKPEE